MMIVLTNPRRHWSAALPAARRAACGCCGGAGYVPGYDGAHRPCGACNRRDLLTHYDALRALRAAVRRDGGPAARGAGRRPEDAA